MSPDQPIRQQLVASIIGDQTLMATKGYMQ